MAPPTRSNIFAPSKSAKSKTALRVKNQVQNRVQKLCASPLITITIQQSLTIRNLLVYIVMYPAAFSQDSKPAHYAWQFRVVFPLICHHSGSFRFLPHIRTQKDAASRGENTYPDIFDASADIFATSLSVQHKLRRLRRFFTRVSARAAKTLQCPVPHRTQSQRLGPHSCTGFWAPRMLVRV